MYQNVYFEKNEDLMHVWDDERGYYTKKYRRYAYVKDGNGSYESIYGERLKRINYWNKEDNLQLYESDVNEVTRFLIDEYGDSDEISDGHVVLTFDIEVEMNSGLPNINEANNAITSVAFHDSATNDYFVYVVNDGEEINKTIKGAKVRSFNTEQDLLMAFVTSWQEISPTIITGWNIDFFDVTYLYNRLNNLFGKGIANRLSPIGKVHWNKYRKRYIIAGVSALDYIALFKNFTYTEYPNYRLDTIARLELGRGKIEYEGNLDQLFRDDIEKFIEYNLVDVELVVDMDKKLQFIQLAQAICHAGHVFYEDFLFSSKWLEGAILTFLRRSGRVAPNKPKRRNSEDVESKFTGAYVKEPKPGLYKWVYDLDLTSLYPSIIMTINISPETKVGKVFGYSVEAHMRNQIDKYNITDVSGKQYPPMDKSTFLDFLDKMNLSVASNGVMYTKSKVGVIPEILNVWFDKRVEYKNLMKKYGNSGNEAKYKFYHQRQLVQKIMLNSLYGVLGLPAFRFYDIDNAEAVTLTGQTVIKTTEMIANKYYIDNIGKQSDYNVYTDTDSVFYEAAPLVKARNPNINVDSDEEMIPAILSVAKEVQDHLNISYDFMSKRLFNVDEHRFDIKQETIAKSGFWVSKKRYAQWIINDNTINCDKLDVKGLDVKRSSFPTYFKEVMSTVLMDILKDTDKDVIDDKIINFKDDMPNQNFVDIAKNSAVKDMTTYHDKNSELGQFKKGTPAHVKAALSYNKLLEHFKCPYKYEPMKDGDKIKWAYLKNNPMGLESVALTGYNDPPQVLDLVKRYIDYDLIWKKELENKLDDFYNAMGWDKPNPNLKKASQFFGF
jgi:DNA polymerase elongation subunit (family B)